jgi:hypothetical protein
MYAVWETHVNDGARANVASDQAPTMGDFPPPGLAYTL